MTVCPLCEASHDGDVDCCWWCLAEVTAEWILMRTEMLRGTAQDREEA